MCLWDAQYFQHIIPMPREVAITTSWTRILQANQLRVGLTITPDVTNTSFWWPDERTGATGTGIVVPITAVQIPHFYWSKHGVLPSRPWFARIAVAGASVMVIEYMLPEWLYNKVAGDVQLVREQWEKPAIVP